MKMIVQDSLDGKTWRPVYLLGEPVVFNNKAVAKNWFKDMTEASTLDWSMGFLCRFTDGRFFRLVYKDGRKVKY